ncbi:hypothetical protein PAMA_012235 [Pampus argenteus]
MVATCAALPAHHITSSRFLMKKPGFVLIRRTPAAGNNFTGGARRIRRPSSERNRGKVSSLLFGGKEKGKKQAKGKLKFRLEGEEEEEETRCALSGWSSRRFPHRETRRQAHHHTGTRLQLTGHLLSKSSWFGTMFEDSWSRSMWGATWILFFSLLTHSTQAQGSKVREVREVKLFFAFSILTFENRDVLNPYVAFRVFERCILGDTCMMTHALCFSSAAGIAAAVRRTGGVLPLKIDS